MNIKNISAIIVAILGLANLLITACGISPIPVDAEGIQVAVGALFTLGGGIAATWYNFSLTKPAKLADEIGSRLKSGELTVKQVVDAIANIEGGLDTMKWETDIAKFL